ncbi:hypothetical protein V3C99_003586 [Haemonchus contortus]
MDRTQTDGLTDRNRHVQDRQRTGTYKGKDTERRGQTATRTWHAKTWTNK